MICAEWIGVKFVKTHLSSSSVPSCEKPDTGIAKEPLHTDQSFAGSWYARLVGPFALMIPGLRLAPSRALASYVVPVIVCAAGHRDGSALNGMSLVK